MDWMDWIGFVIIGVVALAALIASGYVKAPPDTGISSPASASPVF